MESEHIEVGRTRYNIVGALHQGETTEIVIAEICSIHFPRRVLIKRLRPHVRQIPLVRASFLDEMKILSRLNHTQVIQVIDLTNEAPGPLVVMAYMDGASLDTLLRTAIQLKSPIKAELALYLTVRIAEGLAYIHSATDDDGQNLGVIHRDLNPNNILISWSGEVCLVDFGAAQAYSKATKTDVNVAIGTVAYMAPEQTQGGLVDPRTDLFALGLILKALILGDVHAPTKRLPHDIYQIVSRACRSLTKDRYRDAEEMLEACWSALIQRNARAPQVLLRRWLSHIRKMSSSREKTPKKLFSPDLIHHLVDTERAPTNAHRTQVIQRATEDGANPSHPEPPSDKADDLAKMEGRRFEGFVLGACVSGLRGATFAASVVGKDHPLVVQICTDRLLPEFRTHLMAWAQAAQEVVHPGVIPLLKAGTTKSGRVYFVLEEMTGTNLEEVMSEEAPFPVPRVIQIGQQISAILREFHRRGHIAGHLHPGRFVVSENLGRETVRMSAFDLDYAGHAKPPRTAHNYCAPEVLVSGKQSPASDFYAVGTMLLQMLTGKTSQELETEPQALKLAQSEESRLLGSLLQQLRAERSEDRLRAINGLAATFEKIRSMNIDATTEIG